MELRLTSVRTSYCKGEMDISDSLKYNRLHCFISAEFILKMDLSFIKVTFKKAKQNKTKNVSLGCTPYFFFKFSFLSHPTFL